jgi:hypothetical protein
MKWNEVTWYSRLAEIIVLLGILPIAVFYIGRQYEKTMAVINQNNLDYGSLYQNTKKPF